MGQRIEDLVARFEQANNEFIAFANGLSDEQWTQPLNSGDERGIGVIIDHVGVSHVPVAEWVASVAAGQPRSVDMDLLNELNDRHARERANVTRDEAVNGLRDGAAKAVEIIRGIDEDALDRTTTMAAMGGQEVSAQQLAEMIFIGHIGMHSGEIRAAIGA
jgi:hypothetical protein